MNMNVKIKIVEYLCYLAVVALGEDNGTAFEIFPKLPSIFTTNLDFLGIAHNVDFLKVETSDNGLVCWFTDQNENEFFVSMHEVLLNEPMLYSSIVTYIFDMINNYEVC